MSLCRDVKIHWSQLSECQTFFVALWKNVSSVSYIIFRWLKIIFTFDLVTHLFIRVRTQADEGTLLPRSCSATTSRQRSRPLRHTWPCRRAWRGPEDTPTPPRAGHWLSWASRAFRWSMWWRPDAHRTYCSQLVHSSAGILTLLDSSVLPISTVRLAMTSNCVCVCVWSFPTLDSMCVWSFNWSVWQRSATEAICQVLLGVCVCECERKRILVYPALCKYYHVWTHKRGK